MGFMKVLGVVAAGAAAVVAAPVLLPAAAVAAAGVGTAALGAAGAAATGAAALATGAVASTAAAVGAAGAATLGTAAVVGAEAAALATGAAGVLGGAGGLAGAAGAAMVAGAAARRKGKEEGREEGRQDEREKSAATVAKLQTKFAEQIGAVSERFKEHKDFEEFIVATFAMCLALAKCDGEIHPNERDDIFEFVSGIAHGAYPDSMKKAIAELNSSPPSFATALKLVKELDESQWDSVDTALQLITESDGIVHENEETFLMAWGRALEQKKAEKMASDVRSQLASQDESQRLSAGAAAFRDMILAVEL